ncbi:MAG: class I SAM-dependent methyltransferase [Chloroherpetonaceae bacterium]|nr:class I SAM-dependent methyltransferase [Chthonomonadaceae bacterium]MDW8208278.1 class I SAM-dependent methyltransferase [Chloroherpetonaceae bacterium]
MSTYRCRFCDAPLHHVFVDLGTSPLSNAYVRPDQLGQPEPFFPLTVYLCTECFLVQLPAFEAPEHIFRDYAYFSSYSDTWLQHARRYVELVRERFGIGPGHRVVEVASNDGYLLQYFLECGVDVLGIEPAANVAVVAQARGIPTLVRFFGRQTAQDLLGEGCGADLLIGNNVLAHVPDLNDFVAGMRMLLRPEGVLTMEFPHLLRLMAENQFDTIYHEHFSYFSFVTVERVFDAHDLVLFDVEELPTHGGSLRIYARHRAHTALAVTDRVRELREREHCAGVTRVETYAAFAERVHETKRQLLDFLIRARRAGKHIVGYGAPAKGNTLLNYCGIRTDFLDYTVDRSPHKQGLFLPGTRIPIYAPEKIAETRPDYVLILPWNLREEIMAQMALIREWGGQFVVPVPRVQVL